MLRSLKPIEIAEGALLADIAVIYQLLVNYVPFIGDLFRFPIFIVFAIIVLRRGLYVGIISGCVAAFLAGILMGPSLVAFFLIEILGGLYLGCTMRYRFYHSALILLGATFGALAFYALFGAVAFVTGLPISTYIRFLQQTYNAAVQLLSLVAQRLDGLVHLGIEHYWAHSLEPGIISVGHFVITYWWLTLYLLLWGFSLMSTITVYAATNVIVRMLGYDVRPFPSQRFIQRIQRFRRRLLRVARRRKVLGKAQHAEV
jgi:uncharacterized protein YybS (DUF2232 family)